jgi:hypothetical protein
MVLVDTSVWIDHFRRENPELIKFLLNDQVVCHPFIVGELACGNFKNRSEILSLLQALPRIPLISDSEVLSFINEKKLYGKGIGWIDAHLLASIYTYGCSLFTLEKKLSQLFQLNQTI